MADETLRIYKHGSFSYTDVTNATLGGFSGLTLTQIRNDAGSLQFELVATTIAVLHGWMDEAATVEYWENGARKSVYQVDDYSPKWSALTCQVNCVGLLALGKTALYTGNFASGTAAAALEALVAAVPDWTWDASRVSGAMYAISGLSYTDASADQCVQEVCNLGGLTFWFDADGVFNAEAAHTSVDQSFTLGDTANDFDSTYTTRNIINRLIVRYAGGAATYDHAGSQAIYGVRAIAVTASSIYTPAQAADYAADVFAAQAAPVLEGGVWVGYDPALRPGLFVEVLGIGDGRTYRAIITQVAWTLGELFAELRIGQQPVTLTPPVYAAPRVSGGSAGAGGTAGSDASAAAAAASAAEAAASAAGGRLLTGTVSAVGTNTVDVTIGGTAHSSVPYLESYAAPTVGDSVAVGVEQ